jgi:hypothetical protein
MLEHRREPRVAAVLRVEISGKDAQQCPFLDQVLAINLSQNGALLWGVKAELRSGDGITVNYQGRQAQFRVVWILEERRAAVEVAIHRQPGEPCPWEEALPAAMLVGR